MMTMQEMAAVMVKQFRQQAARRLGWTAGRPSGVGALELGEPNYSDRLRSK